MKPQWVIHLFVFTTESHVGKKMAFASVSPRAVPRSPSSRGQGELTPLGTGLLLCPVSGNSVAMQ